MIFRAICTSLLLHALILLPQSDQEGRFRQNTSELHGPASPQLYVVGGNGSMRANISQLARGAVAAKGDGRQSAAPDPRKRLRSRLSGALVPNSVEAGESGQPSFMASAEAKGVDTPPAADMLRQYRLNIARSARQLNVYPRLAKGDERQGTVVVGIVWPASQGHARIVLESSSGHEALDHQALQMIAQAASQAVLPDGLRGRALTVSVPVVYGPGD